mgnify:CR=1 FL=1
MFCERVLNYVNGGNPQGKEVGHLFLLTLLWCNKRVRHRVGRNPVNLFSLNVEEIKTGGDARQHLHFLWVAKENGSKRKRPHDSTRCPGTCVTQIFQDRSHALRLNLAESLLKNLLHSGGVKGGRGQVRS